jgi:hypothetical protein
MSAARVWAAAILLNNGLVLVAGGAPTVNDLAAASAELYNPSTGQWRLTGSMNFAREREGMTLLPNGKVLVEGGTVGGYLGVGPNLASAEIYDPNTEVWTLTGSMALPRVNHQATLLNNGLVLVEGGAADEGCPSPAPCSPTPTTTPNLTPLPGILATSEVYDYTTGTWSRNGNLSTGRERQTATLLQSGQVLITGGVSPTLMILSSAELYNPLNAHWTLTGSMNQQRETFQSTLLPSGQVLAEGGLDLLSGEPTNSAELYDPGTGTWSTTGSMAVARSRFTATLLNNGLVLVVGGVLSPGGVNTAICELYDPATGTWTLTGSM